MNHSILWHRAITAQGLPQRRTFNVGAIKTYLRGVFFGGMACLCATASAGIYTLPVVEDTMVWRDFPNTRFFAEPLLKANRAKETTLGNRHAEVLMGFDLTPFKGQQIRNATLSFTVTDYDAEAYNENGYKAKGLRIIPHQDLIAATFNRLQLGVGEGSSLEPLITYQYPLAQVFLITTDTRVDRRATLETTPLPGYPKAARVTVALNDELLALAGHEFVVSLEQLRPGVAFQMFSKESPLAPGASLSFDAEPLLVPEPTAARYVRHLPQAQCHVDTNLHNGLTSLHRWRGDSFNPNAAPEADHYQRYNWNQLEPSWGDYSGIIGTLLADLEALEPGEKLGFRIRAMEKTGHVMPASVGPNGEVLTQPCTEDGNTTSVPEWNSIALQQRASELLQAIAGKLESAGPDYFDRIAWVDVGFVGRWGEGNGGCVKTMNGWAKQYFVDMYFRNLAGHKLQFVSVTDEPDMLSYALSAYDNGLVERPVGYRRDSLGAESLRFNDVALNYLNWPALTQRWKTAPVVAEFGHAINHQRSMWAISPAELNAWHITSISNGNTTDTPCNNPFDPSCIDLGDYQPAFNYLARNAGARLHLADVQLPPQLNAHQSFALTTQWRNLGSAPVYEPYQVELLWRQGSTVVHTSYLADELSQILPTTHPVTLAETPVLASSMITAPAAGAYDLWVRVVDSSKRQWPRQPWQLCQAKAPVAGAYYLGNVTVGKNSATSIKNVANTPIRF